MRNEFAAFVQIITDDLIEQLQKMAQYKKRFSAQQPENNNTKPKTE